MPPTSASDFASINLQNTQSTALNAQYITLGQEFLEGQVTASSELMAVINGVDVPVQIDVKSTYADGSVKMAVLTLKQPALAADSATPVLLMLAPVAAAQPAISLATLTDANYNFNVALSMHNADGTTTPYSFDAASLLQQAIANKTVSYLLQGAQATEAQIDVPVTGSLHLTLDITRYADGTMSTDVEFNNDLATIIPANSSPAHGAAPPINYDATITQNGNTVFHQTDIDQYQYQTWHTVIASSSTSSVDTQNDGQTVNIQHDIAYLEQTGAIANYDLTTPVSATLLASYASAAADPGWDTPLAVDNITQYMPQTGGRPDIGMTTQGNTVWLMTQSATAEQFALGQADTSGSVPWHYANSVGNYISVDQSPTLWVDSRSGEYNAALAQGVSTNTGWTIDTAHQPDLSYDAYLLTGSQYYLDQLNAQASDSIAYTWTGYRNVAGMNDNLINGNQVRGAAWSLREVDEAAYANSDGSAEKVYFTQVENDNWSWLVNQLPTWTTQEGQAYGYIEGVYGSSGAAIPPWQQDYFALTTEEAAEQGNQNAITVLKWETNFLAGRFLNAANGFNPSDGIAYNLIVGPTSSTYYQSWAQIEQATVAAGESNGSDPTLPQSQGDYGQLAEASLAGLITVTESAVAIKAYGVLLSLNAPYTSEAAYSIDPTYDIIPRLTDGNLLTRTNNIITNDSSSRTIQGTNADQLIYETGSGDVTIVGGSGMNLLYAGLGNDTLIGGANNDYLFGGTGTAILSGGAGTNYLDAGTGKTTFVLNSTEAAEDTIADFKVGTDVLNLINGSGTPMNAAQVASVIASTTQDAAGDTVLQLSPTHTVTLLSIPQREVTASLFSTALIVPLFLTINSQTLAADTGASATDDITNNGAVILTGTVSGAAGTVVEIMDGTTRLGYATVTGTSWTYSATLAVGTHNLSATAVDPSNNAAHSATQPTITVEATPALAITGATELANSTSVVLAGTVTGTGTAVELYSGSTDLGAAMVSSGSWTFTTANLSLGAYSFNAQATDLAGDMPSSVTQPFTVVAAVTGPVVTPPSTVNTNNAISFTADSSNHSLTLLGNYETVAGGVGYLTVDSENGRNTVNGGLGGLSFTENYGGNTITTAAGSTNILNHLNNDTVDSWGADTITSNGATIVAHNNATITTGEQSADTITLFGTDTVIGGLEDVVTVMAGATATIQAGSTLSLNETAATVDLSVDGTATAAISGGADSINVAVGSDRVMNITVNNDGTTVSPVNVSVDGGSSIITLNNAATVHTGAGTVTVDIGTIDATIRGGSGSLSVGDGYGSSSQTETIYGGSGTAVLHGGYNNMVYSGGSGTTEIDGVGSSLTITGGSGAIVLNQVNGSANGATTFTGGSGDATLSLNANGGTITFGTGNTTVTEGSYGSAVTYNVVGDEGGGTQIINGFRIGTDVLNLNGLTVSAETVANGSTNLTLSNNTKIDLTDVSVNLGLPIVAPVAQPTVTINSEVLVHDTGASSTDDITNNGAVTLTGTATGATGTTVKIMDGQTSLGIATVSNGAWTFTTILATGMHALTAMAMDPAGNIATSAAAATIVIDTTAPAVAITTPAETITSSSVVLTGTVSDTTAATVKIMDGQTILGNATVNREGGWTYNATLAAGTNSLVAVATNLAGNTASSTNEVIIVAASAPTVTISSETLASDTGASTTDKITSIAAVTLTGMVTGATGTTVKIMDGHTNLGNATINSNGRWTFATILTAGTHAVIAEATDLAGNTTKTAAAATIIVDKTAPTVAIITPAETITSSSVALTGTVNDAVATTVKIRDGQAILGTATVSNGTWTYNATLATGTNNLTAVATDLAGHTTTSANDVITFTAPAQNMTLLGNYETVAGGVGYLTVDSENGRNTVNGGLGGLSFTENYGGNTITTAAGSTNILNHLNNDTVDSWGADTITSNGATIVAHNNATITTGEQSADTITLFGTDTVIGGLEDVVTVMAGATATIQAGSTLSLNETAATVDLSVDGTATAAISGGADSINVAVGSDRVMNITVNNDGTTVSPVNVSVDGGSSIITLNNAATVHTGAGTVTVDIGTIDATIRGGSGSLSVGDGYGSSSQTETIYGGSGTAVLHGGYNNMVYSGGSGTTEIDGVGSSLTITGGSGAIVLNQVNGSANGATTFTGGSGDATLSLNANGGTITFGTGNTTVTEGSYGSAVTYNVVGDEGGGTQIINGFRIGTDVLNLNGLTVSAETVANGSTNLTLSNNTKIDLTDVSDGFAMANHDQLWLQQSGNNLVIDTLGSTQQTVIDNWFAGSNNGGAVLSKDGYKLDISIQSLVQAMASFEASNGTFNPQTTTHTSLTDGSFGAVAAATTADWHK